MKAAQEQYDTVEFIGHLAAINKVVYNRELALFYADHGLNIDEAVRLTRAEIEVRKDVYGYDALAWALYQAGSSAQADQAMAMALAYGTNDASFHFHAGLIKKAVGDTPAARTHLEAAMKINPHFSLRWSERAREELALLAAGPSTPERAKGQ
ncbi:MAG: hypothetical protein HY678_08470 [Chloroflexi bacterium]|nr:hypothetical protein [Chloroflexota bacterium]